MPVASKEEQIVAKAIKEAETGLKGLEKEIRAAVKKYEKGAFTEQKAKALAKKIAAFMSKQVKVTKMQNAKGFDSLSPQAQADVVWLDKLVNDLNNVLGNMAKAIKLAKKDPSHPTDLKLLVKETRVLKPQINQPPKGLNTLVKQMVKQDIHGQPQFGGYSLLPMMILMWIILDTIVRGLKTKK